MIVPDQTLFPYNAVNLLVPQFQTIDADLFLCKRPLRASDPVQSIGVFAETWMPNPDSLEMRGAVGSQEPTLSTYHISIQCLVRDMDEERGAAAHATLSKIVRAMLYRDDTIRIGLHLLTATVEGSTETTKTFGIRTQRYLSNEVQGTWLYLSQIEAWLETETN
jgi:hypothetical protein